MECYHIKMFVYPNGTRLMHSNNAYESSVNDKFFSLTRFLGRFEEN